MHESREVFVSSEDGEKKETIEKRQEKVGSSNGGDDLLQERNKEAFWAEAKSGKSNKIPQNKARAYGIICTKRS